MTGNQHEFSINLKKTIIVMLLAVLILTRLPFLSAVLCGEEGLFAYAVEQVVQGKTPKFLVARDTDGALHEQVAKHNLAGYVFPGILYAVFYHTLQLDNPESTFHSQRGAWMRLSIFLIYFATVVLAVLMVPAVQRLWGTFLVTSFSYFDLPFIASLQIQYDGAVSTFLCVFFIFCLWRGQKSSSSMAWLFLGTFLLSLGKVEYILAGLGTAVAAGLTTYQEKKLRSQLIIGTALGISMGSLISYLYAPSNFTGGFHIAGSIFFLTGQDDGISGLVIHKTGDVLQYLKENYRWFMPPLLLLIISVYSLYQSKKNREPDNPLVNLSLTASLIIIAGYCAVAWDGDGFPRYFAPAYILTPLAFSALPSGKAIVFRKWPAVHLFLIILLCATSVSGILGRVRHTHDIYCRLFLEPDPQAWVKQNELKEFQTMPSGSSAIGFYSKTIPFICCGWDSEIDKDSMIPVHKSP